MTMQAQVDRSSHLTDLTRFAATFESEELLRKTIETLLTKMPTTSGVQRTHGAQEYGKDIIFYGPGGLSETRLYACVVKNTSITGTVDSNSGARAVFNQAEQALDTAFVNSKGDPERVEHVYVMCPHELSQITLNSIAGKLKTAGQVTFFCGRKLLKLFEDHWPDFLVFDSNLLPAYLNSLQAALDKNVDLANVVFQHSILGDVSKNLSHVYVKPLFKQDLQEFRLSETPLPNTSELEASISRQRVKDLAEPLVAAGKILGTLSVEREHIDVPRTKHMAEELHSLAARLLKAWDEAYKPFKIKPTVERHKIGGTRGKIRYGTGEDEQGPKKSEMELPLENGKAFREECDRVIQSAAPIIEDFRARVTRANNFVTGAHAGAIEALQTEEYRLYCSVQENSRLNPRMLTAASGQRTLDFPEDLLSRHSGPLLITGPAGFGKTSFCKWNTIRDAERFVKRESSVFPVFVPLHQFAQGALGSFQETFLKTSEIQTLLASKKAESDSSFRIRFYLDGLDEIPSVERQHELLELSRNFMLSVHNVDIVLTSREHVFGLGWLPRVRLRELDQDGIRELVNKWLDYNESEVSAFFKQLSAASSSLGRLMEIPLLGALIIAVYRKNKRLPESKVRLYKIFAELLSGGWDIAKDIKRTTQFGSAVKLSVLAHLGTVLHFNRKRQFEEPLFRTAVKDTLPAMEDQWDVLLNELIQDGLLLPVGCNYTFFHHSFQEYFAAQDLCDPSGRKQAKVLRWFLKGEDWWREVLAFYVGMSGSPADLKHWINNHVDQVASLSAIDVSERQKYLHAAVDEYYPPTSAMAV